MQRKARIVISDQSNERSDWSSGAVLNVSNKLSDDLNDSFDEKVNYATKRLAF